MRRLPSIGAIIVCALVLSSCATARTSAAPQYFGLGPLGDDKKVLEEWMPATNVRWTYVWNGLDGGLNTGDGWADKPPHGQGALDFATTAAKAGAIPVFVYFQDQLTFWNCKGCSFDQNALRNLNDVVLMKRYIADWRTLMQRLGTGTYDGIAGFGKTAIVNVEPNLTAFTQEAVNSPRDNCYGLCHGTGNDPALFPVILSKTCDPDVAGLPDNFVGYNQALVRIRDKYAPNVKLGYNASPWATLTDISSDSRPGLDVVAMGRKTAEFAIKSGVDAYDLLFTDITYGDAGYNKYKLKANSYWDGLNKSPLNFQRWETFVRAVVLATRKHAMLWQVPVGNQSFLTMNNTYGHYQDNRGEYFLSHLDELVRAGIVGILFGGGPDGSTSFYDKQKDGITNPKPICNSDGLSSGRICTSKTSTVADDDGGWLRTAGGDYLKRPLTLAGAGADALAPRPTVPLVAPSASPAAACR